MDMKSIFQDRRRLILALHLASSAFLSLPNGVAWYYGDLVVYLNSYWYIAFDRPNLSSSWVLSTYLTGWCVASIVLGTFIKKVDHRLTALAGVVMFDIAFFIGHLSVQYSQVGFILTFGLMSGLGYGILHSEIITRVARIFPRNTALALSVPMSCLSIGGLLYQVAATWYINPDNSGADVSVLGLFKVFHDKSVIDRVPSVFIVLGTMTLCSHVCGLTLTVLLKGKGQTDSDCSQDSETAEICTMEHSEQAKGSFSQDIKRKDNDITNYGSGCSSYSMTLPTEQAITNTRRDKEDRSREEDKSFPHGDPVQQADDVNTDLSILSNGDLNPRQMVKTLRFYILWVSWFANETSYLVMASYYKVFGQLWIHDDHFLTQLGLAMSCIGIVFRPFWGMVIDRFGTKLSMIALTSSFVLTYSFYFFAPQVDRWLFALFTISSACSASALHLTFDVVVLKSFGQRYYILNYGILGTATVVLNLLAPEVFSFLLGHFGWSFLFMAIAVINCVTLVAQVIRLPNL